MKRILLSIGFTLVLNQVLSQNIGIGTNTPNSSAQLDVFSNSKGLLVPRVLITQTSFASPVSTPAEGLLIFNTNTDVTGTGAAGKGFYYWTGARWQKLVSAVEAWSLTGNSNVDTAIHYIGTNQNAALKFRVNNVKAGSIEVIGSNTFLGLRAGQFTKFNGDDFTGDRNTFFGAEAGRDNIAGRSYTFIGSGAGLRADSGFGNTAIGDRAGAALKNGSNNTLVGVVSGGINSGSENVVVGTAAGNDIGAGNGNVMVGANTGNFIQGGSGNVWLGRAAGLGNFGLFPKANSFDNVYIGDSSGMITNGSIANVLIGKRSGMISGNTRFNVFVGDSTGINNSIGNNNTFIGSKAKGNLPNLTNATALGSNALVGASNALVLGSINGVNGSTNDTRVAIGTTIPLYKLHLQSNSSGEGSILDGILVENTNASTGEPGISFANQGVSGTGSKRWTIGLNQTRNLSFNYGTLFASDFTHVTFDSSGKVGMGTVSPIHRLQVSGNVQGGGAEDGVLIENRNTAGVGKAALSFRNAGTGGTGNSYWFAGLNANRNLSFAYGSNFVNSNVHMLLDSTGRLGIGTTTPVRRLVVQDGATSGVTPTTNTSVVFDKGGAPNYVSIHGSSGQEVGLLFGVAGAPVSNATGGILYNSTVVPDGFNFRTNGNNIKMVITGDGKVGIGTNSPGFQLQLSLNSAAKPTSSSWTVASDARLKKNMHKFSDGLSTLNKIDPIWFTYNGSNGLPEETGVGMTAQAMQVIAPYMVKPIGGADAAQMAEGSPYLGIDYGPLQFIMINAIKEQQETINQQRREIDLLKARLDRLEQKL